MRSVGLAACSVCRPALCCDWFCNIWDLPTCRHDMPGLITSCSLPTSPSTAHLTLHINSCCCCGWLFYLPCSDGEWLVAAAEGSAGRQGGTGGRQSNVQQTRCERALHTRLPRNPLEHLMMFTQVCSSACTCLAIAVSGYWQQPWLLESCCWLVRRCDGCNLACALPPLQRPATLHRSSPASQSPALRSQDCVGQNILPSCWPDCCSCRPPSS